MNALQADFKYILLSLLMTSISLSVKAQFSDVHVDGSFNLNYFANQGSYDIEVPDNGFAVRYGLNWNLKRYENLLIGFESGYSERSVIYKFNETVSEVRLRAFDFSPILSVKLLEDLYSELGVGISLYDAALYIDGVPKKLGDGYRYFDVYSSFGITYKFWKFAAVGTRVRYGFIPSLKYQPIGNYGEMQDYDTILNQLTFGFFLRAGFYRFTDE